MVLSQHRLRPDLAARFGLLVTLAMWVWLPVSIAVGIALWRTRRRPANGDRFSRVAATLPAVLVLAPVALAPFLAYLHMVIVFVTGVNETIVARWADPASGVEVVVTHRYFTVYCGYNIEQLALRNLLFGPTVAHIGSPVCQHDVRQSFLGD